MATELHCFLVINISLVILHAFGADTCFAVSVKHVSGLCTTKVPEEVTKAAGTKFEKENGNFDMRIVPKSSPGLGYNSLW
jgi:hypothetical protein